MQQRGSEWRAAKEAGGHNSALNWTFSTDMVHPVFVRASIWGILKREKARKA
jgi:hypothetical protein